MLRQRRRLARRSIILNLVSNYDGTALSVRQLNVSRTPPPVVSQPLSENGKIRHFILPENELQKFPWFSNVLRCSRRRSRKGPTKCAGDARCIKYLTALWEGFVPARARHKVIARDEANGHADAETFAISFRGFIISFVAKQDAYRTYTKLRCFD